MRSLKILCLFPWLLAAAASAIGPTLPNPILFAVQMPIPNDFATIGSTFANHSSAIDSVGRGGDLYIRYGDGTLRNLTREAGYGVAADFQGAQAIAVRDPSVHWDGDKAVFSMVVGAPTQQYQVITTRWQLYEITGLGQGETATITKLAQQPADYNNISPVYLPDDRIAFTSDRPRDGSPHLYPQLDEYESTATNTGLWALDPSTGELALLDHAPSGDFTPIVDSFGRVVFTRWDHLQRDQQADADAVEAAGYGTFNYSDESAAAARLENRDEVFPEPRDERPDLLLGTNLIGHRFNHFFPWMIHPDGTGAETLNHIGRHELHDYFDRAMNDDPSLIEFIDQTSGRFNPNEITNMFQIEEDPLVPGRYLAVDAPEFQTHAAGRVFALNGPPGDAADAMAVSYLTHPSTGRPSNSPPPEHSGLYRDPLPLSDGTLVAVHTAETRADQNEGSRAFPQSRYDFRLRTLAAAGSFLAADQDLTPGISRRVEYWDPDVRVTYDGPFWEMSPVEVRARPRPPLPGSSVPAVEATIFDQERVHIDAFRDDLMRRQLALIISRDITRRDSADRQQPFNLKVAGSSTQTTGDGGKLYEVAYLQLFQGDQIRGLGGTASPDAGRRVLAQVLHDADNPVLPGAPEGAVAVASDGSTAAFVPARRALSWQLTDAAGEPVVRERYWLTFQPGEVRVCASCHGLNSTHQAGGGEPQNPPEALREALRFWRTQPMFSDAFENGSTDGWSTVVGGS